MDRHRGRRPAGGDRCATELVELSQTFADVVAGFAEADAVVRQPRLWAGHIGVAGRRCWSGRPSAGSGATTAWLQGKTAAIVLTGRAGTISSPSTGCGRCWPGSSRCRCSPGLYLITWLCRPTLHPGVRGAGRRARAGAGRPDRSRPLVRGAARDHPGGLTAA
ncbi:hypothetical protein HBB16_16510 [Pseudonocardia sp. MCCB 268]|nr:hypothetical protein [Pseudonocardia cytotoxica]